MPFAQPNWAGGVSPFAVPVYVESTITEPPGSDALVTDVNENGTAVELRFRIPRGDVGAQGARGDPGQDAADPIFSTTVTSHSPTATPSVSVSGDYPTKLLSFVLRDGERGSDGVPGAPGQDAADPIFSTTVTSHSSTATPSVSISGDYPTKLLSFVLRDGAPGAPGLSSSVFEYQFQTATTPPPSSGHIRPNSTTPATTTSIYVSHVDGNGTDQSIILSSIQPDSLISLQKKADDTAYVRFTTSGFTSHTGWTEFFVTEQSSAGLLTNNMQIVMVVQIAGIPGPPGQDAADPVFSASVTSSGPSVTPAVSLTGSYPNLALGFSLRNGQDGSNAANPNFTASLVASGVGVTPAVALTGTYPNLNLGISLQSGAPGVGSATYIKFARSVNNESAGFYSDAYIIVGWNPTSSEIMIRQPTARANVTATALVIFGGSFPSGQNMLLSTVSNDFYFQSSFGQILFIIASESDTTHPFYRFHVTFTSSSGTSHVYALVEKFT